MASIYKKLPFSGEYLVGPGRTYTTIQSALNAIGNSVSKKDSETPKIIRIAGGIYDEDLVIPNGHILTLVAEGTVILGNGLGSNWSSTNSRSITVTFNSADIYGSGIRPALNIITTPEADSTSTFPAISGIFDISGDFNFGGNMTHTINLASVKINGASTKSGAGLTNIQAYRTYFKGAVSAATATILERIVECQFDALVTVDGYNSFVGCEIKAGMTVTTNYNTLPPSGFFYTTFFGTFTGPANSLKMDGTSNYYFITNGASLGGSATKVLLHSEA